MTVIVLSYAYLDLFLSASFIVFIEIFSGTLILSYYISCETLERYYYPLRILYWN